MRDIKCLLNKIIKKKVVQIKRNANSATDWIATEAIWGCVDMDELSNHHIFWCIYLIKMCYQPVIKCYVNKRREGYKGLRVIRELLILL